MTAGGHEQRDLASANERVEKAMAGSLTVFIVTRRLPADPALAADLDGTLRELVTTASP